MATIENLNVSILKLPYEEAFALVKRLRESRRTKKVTRVVIKNTNATPRVAKPKNPKDFAALLTSEQKAALLKLLTNGD